MPDLPISDIHFLYFIIPGFITVWSYRYFTYSKEKGDFNLLGLSFFWGIVMVGLMGYLVKDKAAFAKNLENPYASALAFSTIGFILAALPSAFKEKNRPRIVYLFFKEVIQNIFHYLLARWRKKRK